MSGHGVVRRHLSYGWLPVGYSSGEYILGDRRESLDANSGANVVRAQVFQAGITPPAEDPQPPDSGWSQGKGSTLVNGHPTRFVTAPDSSGDTNVWVQWQWAADSWAQVSYFDKAPNMLDTARRVASHLRLDAGALVRLPATASGLPSKLRLQEVTGYDPGTAGAWTFGLTYAASPKSSSSLVAYSRLFVRVSQMTAADRAMAGAAPEAGGRNTTVQGLPARRSGSASADDPSDDLTVWGVHGCAVSIFVDGREVLDLFGRDGVLDVWPHFTFNGQREQWV